MEGYLVRYGEIALKGANFIDFENLLVKNIRNYLAEKKIKFDEIRKIHKRILIITKSDCSFLKYIFGIASFSSTVSAGLDIGEIEKKVFDLVKCIKFKKFRVSARRGNKKFSYNSMKVNIIIGDLIRNKLKKKVDLTSYDLDVGIELLDRAYIFTDKFKGPGGLPMGIEGNVVSLIEDNASLLASYLIMKRGCNVVPVAYKKFDIGLLKKFDFGLRLNLVKNIEEVEKVAKETGCNVLVSRQTLDGLNGIKTKLVVLRPLIGFDEEDIKVKLDYLQKL